MAGPSSVRTWTTQPAQPPTAQAMNSSRETWQGRSNRGQARPPPRAWGAARRRRLPPRARASSVQALQPLACQVGDIALEAPGIARKARQPAGHAPVVQQGHGGDDSRAAGPGPSVGTDAAGRGRAPPIRAWRRAEIGRRERRESARKTIGGMPTPPPMSKGPLALGCAWNGWPMGPRRLMRSPGRLSCEQARTLADRLVEELDPALPWARAHDGQGPAQGQPGIAAQVDEGAGQGVPRALRGPQPQHVLVGGMGLVAEDLASSRKMLSRWLWSSCCFALERRCGRRAGSSHPARQLTAEEGGVVALADEGRLARAPSACPGRICRHPRSVLRRAGRG